MSAANTRRRSRDATRERLTLGQIMARDDWAGALGDFATGVASGALGFPGDVAGLVAGGTMAPSWQMGALDPIGALAMAGSVGNPLPTSEDVRQGITSRPRSTAATLGEILSPGPGELAHIATGALPLAALTFAGRGAKTADALKLAQAERMAAEGASREDIWNATGWFQGVDGMWRFEIDDSGARLGVEAPYHGTSRLGDVLDHPELYAAYPELADVQASLSTGRVVQKGGYFEPAGNAGSANIRASATEPQDALSVLLHETTHGVQGQERFADGGAPSEFIDQRTAILTRDALQWKREVDQKLASMPGADRLAAENALIEEYRQIGALDWVPDASARDIANQPWFAEPEQQAKAELRVREYGLDKRATPYDPVEAYRRLAGEAEARLVQARRDMTAGERAATPPWLMYDVPEAEQIVRFGDGAAAMASEPKPGIRAFHGRGDK